VEDSTWVQLGFLFATKNDNRYVLMLIRVLGFIPCGCGQCCQRFGDTCYLYHLGEFLYTYILWHADPFLGNDRKRRNYTKAVTRQRFVNSNRLRSYSCPFVVHTSHQFPLRSLRLSVEIEIMDRILVSIGKALWYHPASFHATTYRLGVRPFPRPLCYVKDSHVSFYIPRWPKGY
jgi:hypothetical protein